jgi:hypothetical protein
MILAALAQRPQEGTIPLHNLFLRHLQQLLIEMAYLFSLGTLAGVKAKRLKALTTRC